MRLRIVSSIMIIIVLNMSMIGSASVPAEYQTGKHMTDYDIWTVSKQHQDQKWAQNNLAELVRYYTNGWRCYSCLDQVMQRKFRTETRIDRVKTLPGPGRPPATSR